MAENDPANADSTPPATGVPQQDPTQVEGTQPPSGSPEKDPSEWVTGEEPMTGPQASYLQTLSQQAGEPFDETLNKAQASERIDELQSKTGRGQGS